MKNLTEFFLDDAGEFSCMRLLTFVIVLAVLCVWVYGNIKSGTYIPLGYGEAGIISAAIGSKAAQGYFEYGRGE